MKNYLIIFTFLLGDFFGSAQTMESPIKLINEIRISGNYSLTSNPYITNAVGFGVGVYRAAFEEKKVNFVLGVGYNRTNQKSDSSRSIGLGYSLENSAYSYHTLIIPTTARINFGKTVKAFAELGPQFNLNLTLKEEANKMINGEQQENYTKKYKTYANISALGALGIVVPVKNKEILFRASYTYNFSSYDIGFKEDWVMPNHYASFGIGLSW